MTWIRGWTHTRMRVSQHALNEQHAMWAAVLARRRSLQITRLTSPGFNVGEYRMMELLQTFIAHLVRGIPQFNLTMDRYLVLAADTVDSFFLSLLVFPHPCSVWKPLWFFCSAGSACAWSSFPLLRSSCIHLLSDLPVMVRRCGVPRREGVSSHRGPASHSSPHNITPLASASPTSPPPKHSRPSLNSSFQTTWFKFRSRFNKPLISASTTTILMEEEDVPTSSDNNSMSHSQSQSQHRSGL